MLSESDYSNKLCNITVQRCLQGIWFPKINPILWRSKFIYGVTITKIVPQDTCHRLKRGVHVCRYLMCIAFNSINSQSGLRNEVNSITVKWTMQFPLTNQTELDLKSIQQYSRYITVLVLFLGSITSIITLFATNWKCLHSKYR